LPRASSLEAALERELGVVAELIEGGGGVYDVVADGDVVFSKHTAGRFPEDAEIVELLRSR
jgi:predicted Rdx family selenoprotein